MNDFYEGERIVATFTCTGDYLNRTWGGATILLDDGDEWPLESLPEGVTVTVESAPVVFEDGDMIKCIQEGKACLGIRRNGLWYLTGLAKEFTDESVRLSLADEARWVRL